MALARSLGWSVLLYTKMFLGLTLARARPWVAGSIPSRVAYRRYPMGVFLSHCCSSPPPSLFLSLSKNQ